MDRRTNLYDGQRDLSANRGEEVDKVQNKPVQLVCDVGKDSLESHLVDG